MKKRVLGIIMAGIIAFSGSFSFAQAAVQGKKTTVAKPVSSSAIKRSDFAVILRNALNIRIEYFKAPNIKDYYNDIKQDAPYASAVIDLVTTGIFQGKGSFKPNGTLTKEEMIHYIMNAYKYKMGDKYVMIKIRPATFKDTNKIAPIYSGEVARAQYYKLIRGDKNNMFYPKKVATKAEAEAIINKLTALLKKQNQQTSEQTMEQVLVNLDADVKDDSILMNMTIKNNTKNDTFIECSSGQKFDFELLDANKSVVYRWSEDKMFTMALQTLKIEAGKTLEFSAELSGDKYKAVKNKIVYLKGYITGKSSFVNTRGYEIKLK